MNINHLRELENTGKYLFHGSVEKIETALEPRQAYTIQEGKRIKDGLPGVHATPVLDIAIFMATANPKNAPERYFQSRFNNDNNIINLAMVKNTADQITEKSSGYVYVFDIDKFEKRSGIEYVSYSKIEPKEVVEVKYCDILTPVEVFYD